MFATMLLVAGSSVLAANEKATLTTTDAADFNTGGRIEITISFGDLHIVGWSQPRPTRSTRDRINATAGTRTVEDQLRRDHRQYRRSYLDWLTIRPRFRNCNLFTRPVRAGNRISNCPTRSAFPAD